MRKIGIILFLVFCSLFAFAQQGNGLENQRGLDNNRTCEQIMTYAQNKGTGECRQFSNTCDVPEDWNMTDCNNNQDMNRIREREITTERIKKTIKDNKDIVGRGITNIIPDSNKLEQMLEQRINDLNRLLESEITGFSINPAKMEIRTRIKNTQGEENMDFNNMNRIRTMIETMTGPIDLNIVHDANQWRIRSSQGDIEIKNEIEIDGNRLYMWTEKQRKEIRVLPDQASDIAKQRVNMHRVNAVRMDTAKEEITYNIQGTQRGKLLGIFDVEMNVETNINANTGQVKNESRPWWSFAVMPE